MVGSGHVKTRRQIDNFQLINVKEQNESSGRIIFVPSLACIFCEALKAAVIPETAKVISTYYFLGREPCEDPGYVWLLMQTQNNTFYINSRKWVRILVTNVDATGWPHGIKSKIDHNSVLNNLNQLLLDYASIPNKNKVFSSIFNK